MIQVQLQQSKICFAAAFLNNQYVSLYYTTHTNGLYREKYNLSLKSFETFNERPEFVLDSILMFKHGNVHSYVITNDRRIYRFSYNDITHLTLNTEGSIIGAFLNNNYFNVLFSDGDIYTDDPQYTRGIHATESLTNSFDVH